MNFYQYDESQVFQVIQAFQDLTIIDSNFDPENGYSYVTISTPDGTFTGKAFVHPDDFKDLKYTSLTGQTIAHFRALIKYLKYLKRVNYHIYNNLNRVWAESKKYNATSDNLKAALLEISSKINLYKSTITYLELQIKKKIEGSDKYYRKKVRNK